MTNDAYYALVILFGTIVVAYLAVIILIATLRNALWLFSGLFFLIDEFMWFAYNPLRTLMKDKEASANLNRPLFAGDPEVRILGYGKEQIWKQIFIPLPGSRYAVSMRG